MIHHETRFTPSLEWLRTFVAFAATMSFTRAAEELHLSQPAVHVQVKKLAEQLGVELYRRRGKALELTDEGVRAVAFGRELLERSDRFLDELRAVPHAQPTVVAAGEGALLYVIGDAMSRALRAELRIQLRVLDTAGVIQALQRGEAHAGVTVLEEPPSDLEGRALVESGSLLVVPRAHPLAKRRSLRLTDLDGVPLVAPPRGARQRELLDSFTRAAGVRADIVVEARGWPLTLRLVELGVGAAVVNDVVRIPRSLTGVRLRGLPPQIYWALRRANAEPSAAAASFWSMLTTLAMRGGR